MKNYSLSEITKAWTDYRSKKVLRVLKQGKWVVNEIGAQPLSNIEGTKAELCSVSGLMGFPKFLNTYYG